MIHAEQSWCGRRPCARLTCRLVLPIPAAPPDANTDSTAPHPSLAVIIDDRVKVWEPNAQPQTLQICPFLPYDTAASMFEGATAAWSLLGAKTALEEARSGFFKELQGFSEATTRVRPPILTHNPPTRHHPARPSRVEL